MILGFPWPASGQVTMKETASPGQHPGLLSLAPVTFAPNKWEGDELQSGREWRLGAARVAEGSRVDAGRPWAHGAARPFTSSTASGKRSNLSLHLGFLKGKTALSVPC